MRTMCFSIAPNWAIRMEFISKFRPDVFVETVMVRRHHATVAGLTHAQAQQVSDTKTMYMTYFT